MTKTITCMKLLVEPKITFLSMQSILLAILLHGQFIQHTQISLHQNTYVVTAKHCAYKSF